MNSAWLIYRTRKEIHLLPGELLKAEIKEQKSAANSLQENRGSKHTCQWVKINNKMCFSKDSLIISRKGFRYTRL